MNLRKKLRLAAEIAWCAAKARAALREDNLPAALRTLRDSPLSARTGLTIEPDELARLDRAVRRTLSIVRARCLLQSVTLCAMLARRGVRSRVVIGVQPGERFGAHAWVELDRQAGPPVAGSGGFARLVAV